MAAQAPTGALNMTTHLLQQLQGARPHRGFAPGATCRAPLRRRGLVAAQARPDRLEATLPQSSKTRLEHLFLAASVPPAAAAAQARGAPDQQPAGSERQHPGGASKRLRRHRKPHHHQEEVCGKLVCVEHVGDGLPERPSALAIVATAPAAAAAALDSAAAAPAAVPGLLGRLLEIVPMSPRTQGIVMLNVLVLLVATNWVVVKDVGGSFDPLGFAFLRFAVAALAFSPFMKAASKDGRIVQAGVELGMWTAAGYITQSLGLLTTDASRASFLSTFTVLVVPLLAGMSGKGVSPVTWASCLAALVGVGLLEQSGAAPGIGDAWSMLSAVAFGIQMFRTEHWARVLGNGANLPLMSVVLTTTMGFAALASGVTHWEQIVQWVQHPEALQAVLTAGNLPWMQVLYCGLLTTDLALLLEIVALQSVSSVDAAIIYTLEPVLGASFAWALLGERLGAKGMLGAGIIVVSSLATQLLGGNGDKEPGSESDSADEAVGSAAALLKED
ncbi:hypothetical protein C2E20_6446 [Micractinium conductrix]|uniref:EamA domain-containing protein n=1 Tax=Micractinium conductrix TaxID=554055 RepID=A0A2P6V7P2_9CHLO|nr:hypothetical protein C2E20_6446 [Micractinium conductrix]|eukprot:PSC70106.1 hypothetical protein C2E20_6446 [Micractinium conductrix]